MPDFTLTTYHKLLKTLLAQDYTFLTLEQFFNDPVPEKTIILRHDIDLRPGYSLEKARLEHTLGIRSTYYFRIIPEVFQPDIIREIAGLGHEVGYHYEDLSLAAEERWSESAMERWNEEEKQEVGSNKRTKRRRDEETKRGGGSQRSEIRNQKKAAVEAQEHASSNDRTKKSEETKNSSDAIHRVLNALKSIFRRDKTCLVSKLFCRKKYREKNKDLLKDRAYQLFRHHLEQFRQYYPVKTICMHGNPKSPFDSRDIWKNRQEAGQEYNYRNLGIIGEPYFDIDFNKVFYLTDTGRRWDGWKVSLRDKIPQQEQWKKQGLVFHSTKDIIKAPEKNNLPNKIMITTHPQRWTDKPLPWVKELVWQRVKNVVKGILVFRDQ